MTLPLPTDDPALAADLLALLRGRDPGRDPSDAAAADAALARLECGGYVRGEWVRRGTLASLPPGWGAALERAHRRTLLDTLAALAEFRVIGTLLRDRNIPFIVLKGTAYLGDLYADVGERPITDLDLLVRPADARRAHALLADAGHDTVKWDDVYRRFEVVPRGGGRCACEVHWRLGLPERLIDQEAIWSRAEPTTIEGIDGRRLARQDALLYHVGHQADHFFGPSLKWVVDLRLMLRRWGLDAATLPAAAKGWGVRVALGLAAEHMEKLFPGEVPAALRGETVPGPLRRRLLRRFRDPGPLLLLRVDNARLSRYLARSLILDRPADILRGAASALRRASAGAPAAGAAVGASD